VHQAIKALQRAMSIDPALQSQVEELESTAIQLEEIARGLSRYSEAIEDSPERLQEVEERLELLRRLKHRYGPTLEDVIRFGDEMRQRLQDLECWEEQRRQLETECQKLRTEAGELAERLSSERRQAAQGLASLVNSELAELGMPWARFDITLTQEECPDGLPAYQGTYSFTQYGIDRVQFLASTNPGEPLRPLAEIASGGETCRFMLALKSALRQTDSIPTLVFDEIDAGIGGRNADTVGKKLATLAESRQVICITHLPQIACFGSDHYRAVKDVSGGRAAVRLEHLSGDTRLEELAAMLGGDKGRAMLESAQQLLRCAVETGKARLISVPNGRNR